MELFIVTGISGSGKTTVLNALEDAGYYCVDNLMPELIKEVIQLIYQFKEFHYKGVAIVVDAHSPLFLSGIYTLKDWCSIQNLICKIIFLEAEDAILLQRYRATRRVHPLSKTDTMAGIQQERILLKSIKNMADIVIDTTPYTPNELKLHCLNRLTPTLSHLIVLKSFGFKKGILADADFVFDVRCLQNPYYDEKLRSLTGKDELVKKYIFQNDFSKRFVAYIYNFLNNVLPNYFQYVKDNVLIGIGCTGGRHRSVAVVEELEKMFSNQKMHVCVEHRDLK